MSKLHIVFGSFALLLYLVLFTAGLSRDSAPYRERLLPQRPQASTVKTFSTMNDPSVVTAALASSTSHREQSQGTAAAPPFDLVAFLAVMCLFTPTNVAFLTLIAGFLGGCASNITFERTVQKDASNSTNLPPECIVFRTENPAASMFRSFLVYLGFMGRRLHHN